MSSPFKYEWPYVQYITRDEKKEYTATLPADLDRLKVRHLVPTEIWRREYLDGTRSQIYIPEEQVRTLRQAEIRSGIWGTLYGLTLWTCMVSMSKWYNTNLILTHSYFKTESWPKYISIRFFPLAFCAWTAYVAFSGRPFSTYPTSQTLVDQVNKHLRYY